MKSSDNKILNDNSFAFLEDIDTTNKLPDVSLDAGVFSQAKELNINLEDLENVRRNAGLLATPSSIVDDEINDEIAVAKPENFIEYAEVRLKDVADKLLESLERPAVVVCDDKVIYINKVMLDALGAVKEEVEGSNLLDFVKEEEWSVLAENIGVMLTDGRNIDIHFKRADGGFFKIDLEALYLPDENHFAFILMGKTRQRSADAGKQVLAQSSSLYDQLTGLPNFYLFEDRVHVAVNEDGKGRGMVAVIGVSIDNMAEFRQIGLEELILKKIASKLVLTLKKSHTVARGLKYQFWVLINGVASIDDLDKEIKAVKSVLDAGVEDNFVKHDLVTSIGVSAYPLIAKSGKRLLDQVIRAIKQAQEKGGGVVLFEEEK